MLEDMNLKVEGGGSCFVRRAWPVGGSLTGKMVRMRVEICVYVWHAESRKLQHRQVNLVTQWCHGTGNGSQSRTLQFPQIIINNMAHAYKYDVKASLVPRCGDHKHRFKFSISFWNPILFAICTSTFSGARGSVVVKALMLQTGRSRVRFPMRWIFKFT
jgi:hypothetical protein